MISATPETTTTASHAAVSADERMGSGVTDSWRSSHLAMPREGQSAGDGAGGALVCFADPRRVDLQRRGSATPMPKAAGDGAEVDACREELGGVVVPQLVQGRGDPESLGHAIEPLSHGVGHEWTPTVRVQREEEGLVVESEAEFAGVPILTPEVLLQDGDGALVEGDAALLVGLGVLRAHPCARAGD